MEELEKCNNGKQEKRVEVDHVSTHAYLLQPVAVSYTHLDVYKRQVIQCSHCNRWQHRACYGTSALWDFNCNICKPRIINSTLEQRKQLEAGAGGEIEESQEKDLEEEPLPNFHLLTDYEYKDKYVSQFIDKHSDDDWVLPYNGSTEAPKVAVHVTGNSVHVKQVCLKGDLIDEFLGVVDFQKNYIMDPINQYRLWGTTKRDVIFHSQWPLLIDAREKSGRFRSLRRSCNPNVELVTVKLGQDQDKHWGDSTVKFMIRAKRTIQAGEELHINWQWDLRHPIWQIIMGSAGFESLTDMDKYWLIYSVETVLENYKCACGDDNKDCHLLKVREFSKKLQKDFKSKSNNRSKLNEILNRNKKKPITEKQSP